MLQIYSQHELCDVDFCERVFVLVSYLTLANHIAGAEPLPRSYAACCRQSDELSAA